jgi:vitamin B12 transporter
LALASTSVFCFSETVHAQPAVPVSGLAPEQVVITGRLEEDLPARLAQAGTRVETITSVEIQNSGALDIAQALPSQIPGLYISPKNGPFDYVDISLQGSRTQDVLWLVDGVRINNRLYGGTTPLDTLPAAMVERVEVLEGPQSLFYGTQSIAGAINIVTKGFSERANGSLMVGADTQGGRHIDGNFADSINGHHFVVYGSSDRSDGYQPFRDQDYQPSSTDRNRKYDVLTIGGKYAYDFNSALRFTVSEMHTDATLDFANPQIVLTAVNERNEDVLSAKFDYTPNNELQFFVKGYYHWWYAHYTEFDNDVDNSTGALLGTVSVIDNHDFWGFTDYGLNAVGRYAPQSSGLEYYLGYDYQNYTGRDVVLVITQKTEHVNAVFGEIATTPDLLRDVRLSAGFRYNSPSVGESATVWNVSGRWDINNNLFVRGMAGTAFRLPTAEELFADDPNDERGNPDLKPEKSTNVNASIGGTISSWLRLEGIFFYRDVKNLIDLDTFDDNTNQDVFGNIAGTVRVRGGEFVVNAAVTNDISLQGSFTFNEAKNSETDLQINRVPEQLGQATFDYHPMNSMFGFTASLNYVGKVHDTLGGGIGRQEYGNYVVVDLSGRVFLDQDRHHRFDIGVRNLFDEEYASRLIRARHDLGNTSYEAQALGWPQTFYARYTYSFF